MKNLFAMVVLLAMLVALIACSNNHVVQEVSMTTQYNSLHTEQTSAFVRPAEEFPYLGFDSQNPNGWIASNEDGSGWNVWQDWMHSQGLSFTEDDYSFGDFWLGMTREEAAPFFPSEPYESENQAGDIILTFDAFELVFWSFREPLTLYSIRTTDPSFLTPRGLRVGDDAETVVALYGVPVRVWDELDLWSFGDGVFSNPLVITVADGIVIEIELRGAGASWSNACECCNSVVEQ